MGLHLGVNLTLAISVDMLSRSGDNALREMKARTDIAGWCVIYLTLHFFGKLLTLIATATPVLLNISPAVVVLNSGCGRKS